MVVVVAAAAAAAAASTKFFTMPRERFERDRREGERRRPATQQPTTRYTWMGLSYLSSIIGAIFKLCAFISSLESVRERVT